MLLAYPAVAKKMIRHKNPVDVDHLSMWDKNTTPLLAMSICRIVAKRKTWVLVASNRMDAVCFTHPCNDRVNKNSYVIEIARLNPRIRPVAPAIDVSLYDR